jgi:hypothetical protein
MALALGKLNFFCAVIGLTCMPTKPEPLNLGVPVVNFHRVNAILARAQALLWVRDWNAVRRAVHNINSEMNIITKIIDSLKGVYAMTENNEETNTVIIH